MRRKTERQDTADTLGYWTCSETIDDETSSIHVRGRVDRLGVDLLRATIEDSTDAATQTDERSPHHIAPARPETGKRTSERSRAPADHEH